MSQARFIVSSAQPTTLSTGAASSGSIQVASMPGTWPSSFPYSVLVDWGTSVQEAVSVTAVSGSGPFTLTCTRGIDGTTAQSHLINAPVVHGVTEQDFLASCQGYWLTLLQTAPAALSTTATTGFMYVPSCPGPPTGVPVTQTGLVPLVLDSTGGQLWAYLSGAWKAITLS
jgi:hypothetical protein